MKILNFYRQFLIKTLSISIIKQINHELILKIQIKDLIPILSFLKYNTNCQYKVLTDLGAIDYLKKKKRFVIFYQLLSIRYNSRLTLQIDCHEWNKIPSIIGLFFNANWLEREVWDLFGILFKGHPELRRILTDYGFEQHPLRKDFPLTGYLEVFFCESKKRISYKPVYLSQNLRLFSFQNPWIPVSNSIK